MATEKLNLDAEIDRTEVATLKFDTDSMASIFGEKDLWPSWVADMDFPASRHIREALARRVEHGIYGYENSSSALPEAVAAWYAKRHRWRFDAQNIVFSPRTLSSISTLIELFSEPGDGIIVQPPVFYDFKLLISANKRRLIKNPLSMENGVYRMDFDQLQTVAAEPNNSLLILCNPHNPIGRVWSREDLSRLDEICRANGVFVISDEIHGDITYGRPYTPFASLADDAARNSATCISPVKSFNLAGVANSMIVIPDDERRARCKGWYSRFEVNKNNVFASAAMLAAYTRGESWLDQVVEYLRGNIEVLEDFLEQNLPRVKLIQPEGTFLIWLDFRDLKMDPKRLASFLVHEARIAGNPGHWFGREGVGFARINIACPRGVLSEALKNLHAAVEGLAVEN